MKVVETPWKGLYAKIYLSRDNLDKYIVELFRKDEFA